MIYGYKIKTIYNRMLIYDISTIHLLSSQLLFNWYIYWEFLTYGKQIEIDLNYIKEHLEYN